MLGHPNPATFQVLVAGGGVAGLEAALALAQLAPGLAEVTLLATAEGYLMRPLVVREPFGGGYARRYDIDRLLGSDIRHVRDDLDYVDTEARAVITRGRQRLNYDALIVATGAKPTVRYAHAITMDDRKTGAVLDGMVQDIEADLIRRVAFVAPERTGWPLPLYELALLTHHRAAASGIELETMIVTPEDRPLDLFGAAVSHGVQELLRRAGIEVYTSANAEVPQRREIVIHPGERRLAVDRVVALPELVGPALPGLPQDARGFIPIDEFGRVPDAGPVFAAGDVTDYPIKHGGIAAQIAVAAARSIAVLAGAPIKRTPIDPVLHGMLLTGGEPKYLKAHRVGGHSFDSVFSDEPTWESAGKVTTRYLAPRLALLEGEPVAVR